MARVKGGEEIDDRGIIAPKGQVAADRDRRALGFTTTDPGDAPR